MSFTIVRTPFPTYINTVAEAVLWNSHYMEKGVCGYDTETTGLDLLNDRVRFFSFACDESRICAPVRLLPYFAEVLESPDVEKRMSNAKYDMHLTMNHDIWIQGHIQDSIDQDHLYDENRQGRHGLKETAYDHLGLTMTSFKEVFGDPGNMDAQVKLMCEVHDILELKDTGHNPALADELAKKVLIRLGAVHGAEDLIKDLKKLDLSLRAGLALKARQVLAIARKHGQATKTYGPKGYISDYIQLLGGEPIRNHKVRTGWVSVLEDQALLREAHEVTWELLMDLMGLTGDPVEYLRTRVMDYASLDAWASYALVDDLRDKLDLEDMITEGVDAGEDVPVTLLEHSEKVRVPFIKTLWLMERRGVKIDVGQCYEYAEAMAKDLADLEREIVRITGSLEFNPKSTKHLREYFYVEQPDGTYKDILGNKPFKMTKGGSSGVKQPSTDKDVLEYFSDRGEPLAVELMKHRKLSKLYGDYLISLPQKADANDRVHTSLLSHGTRTWRLASRNPNLWN